MDTLMTKVISTLSTSDLITTPSLVNTLPHTTTDSQATNIQAVLTSSQKFTLIMRKPSNTTKTTIMTIVAQGTSPVTTTTMTTTTTTTRETTTITTPITTKHPMLMKPQSTSLLRPTTQSQLTVPMQ